MKEIDILIFSPVSDVFSKGNATRQDIFHRVNMFAKLKKKVVLIEFIKSDEEIKNHKINKFIEVKQIVKKNNRKFIDYKKHGFYSKEEKQKIMALFDVYRPKIVWFEYDSFFLIILCIKKKYPDILIYIRSHNYEIGHHCEKWKFQNRKKYIPLASLLRLVVNQIQFIYLYKKVIKYVESIYCISRVDMKKYQKKFPNGNWQYLPMYMERKNQHTVNVEKEVINFVYLSSNLENSVNREGVLNLIAIASRVEHLPVMFHCTGNDIVRSHEKLKNIKYHGYVEKYEDFLNSMDVSVVPSSIGYGMKGKVYDLLNRGMPSIVSKRVDDVFLGKSKKAYLVCNSIEEWVVAIEVMLDIKNRKIYSKNAITFMNKNFSKKKYLEILVKYEI